MTGFDPKRGRDEALVWLDLLAARSDRAKMTREIDERMSWVLDRLESPIEAVFAWHFATFVLATPLRQIDLSAEPQVWFDDREFGRYRFDFSILAPQGPLHIAVELDGHDFHERTPDQVIERNSRDRRMQLHKWRMLHFSGREVLSEPMSCAGQTWLVALQRAHRWGWV